MTGNDKSKAREVRMLALPVMLTAGELAIRGQELATAEGELTKAEVAVEDWTEAAKATKKQMETDVRTARYVVRKLGGVVRDKKELRQVQVEDRFDYEGGTVDTIRLDTKEAVATRGMTQEERQRNLFDVKKGEQTAAADKAKK